MECRRCDALVSSLEANARAVHTGRCGVCGGELTTPRMHKAPKPRLRLHVCVGKQSGALYWRVEPCPRMQKWSVSSAGAIDAAGSNERMRKFFASWAP